MAFPTSVNVAPASRLTCTFPSSVPAHTTPGITGDSETEMIVLYDTTPSFFDSCVRSPGDTHQRNGVAIDASSSGPRSRPTCRRGCTT